MNPKIPSTLLAWKPIKIALGLLLKENAKKVAMSITKVSVPILIVYGNVLVVIEAECGIYCCKNDRYNPREGLTYFSPEKTLEFYFGNYNWSDLGYDDELLP